VEGISKVVGDERVHVVAIVGCSKNSGKTTTLNRIIGEVGDSIHPFGLLSIGIDGEHSDFWLGLPKPSIRVVPGTLVATTNKALDAGSAVVRTIARTGTTTPLGELLLGRVDAPGSLLLAGIRHKADLRRLVGMMTEHGASKVLIDGSYQRLMSADPLVSQGVILSTGAVLGRTVTEVVDRTEHVLQRLLLPAVVEPDDKALLAESLREARPVVRDTKVAIPGAVTDSKLRSLSPGDRPDIRVIIEDPTRLFASPDTVRRFRSQGGELLVGRAIRVLAVTVNPTSVAGTSLPPRDLLDAVRGIVTGIPVFLFEDQ